MGTAEVTHLEISCLQARAAGVTKTPHILAHMHANLIAYVTCLLMAGNQKQFVFFEMK